MRLAELAGRALLALRQKFDPLVDSKPLRDEGDRVSHDLLLVALAEAYPADPILSEEGKDNLARLKSRRVWIVDPLDGTREFGEVGRTDWAVHIAFVVDGFPAADRRDSDGRTTKDRG